MRWPAEPFVHGPFERQYEIRAASRGGSVILAPGEPVSLKARFYLVCCSLPHTIWLVQLACQVTPTVSLVTRDGGCSMHPDVVHETDLRIPIGNETVAATRFTPERTDQPTPAVLWATPYPKERERFGRYGPIFEYLAGHGFEVVLANLVGTGASTGRFHGLATPETGRQCAKLIEWIADQSWTTDRVGVIGKSAGGYTSLATAAAAPDALAVAIPIMAPTETRRTLYGPGGTFRLASVLGWTGLFSTLVTEPPNRRDEIDDWRDQWERRLEMIRNGGPKRFGFPGVFTDESAREFWSYELPLDEIEVPMFIVGGVRDTFSAETIEYFDRIDAPKRLLLGPWRHVIPHRGRESAIDFRPRVVAWLDQFLRNEDRGVLERPTVTFWTERDGGRQVDAGVWRGSDGWPSAETHPDPMTFVVTADGLRTESTPESLPVERTYGFDQTVGVASTDYGRALLDTNPDDVRSMVFETEPFETPFEWTGTARASVQLTSSTAPAMLSVRAVDVGPDGRARLVTRGAQRLGDGPEMIPIDPDAETTVPLTFGPASHLFESGHRLRVALAAADFPRSFPVDSDGEFIVSSRPTARTVLTVPGQYRSPAEFADTVPMDPPDDALPVAAPSIVDQHAEGETCRSHYSGSVTINREVSTELEFPHVNRVEAIEYELSVTADDPQAAVGRSTYTSHLQHENDPVRVESETRITHAERSLTLRVFVDDVETLDRTWSTNWTPIL